MKKKRLKWIELVGIIVIVAALVAIIVPALSRAREASNRASCQDNLKQWGAIFKMYASESKGYYPRCATKNERTNTNSPGHGFVAAPYGPSLYPNYLSDLSMYFCPSSKVKAEDYTRCPGGCWCNINTNQLDGRNFDDCSYTYYGWAATNENEFAAMIACLHLKNEDDPKGSLETADEDLDLDDFGGATAVHTRMSLAVGGQFSSVHVTFPVVAGNGYSTRINRLREGVERFLITEIHGLAGTDLFQSLIPIIWDRINEDAEYFSHVPRGCNILYMDGHVEFVKYPGRYPISKTCATWSRVID